MITTIFIGLESDEEDFQNGINLLISDKRFMCVDSEDIITIKIIDEANKLLLPEFEISLKLLRKALCIIESANTEN